MHLGVRIIRHLKLHLASQSLEDMILPIKFEADWALIEKRKQMSINNSNRQENKKRFPHTYAVGDKVLLTKPGILRKMSTPYSSPYIVQHVFKWNNKHPERCSNTTSEYKTSSPLSRIVQFMINNYKWIQKLNVKPILLIGHSSKGSVCHRQH